MELREFFTIIFCDPSLSGTEWRQKELEDKLSGLRPKHHCYWANLGEKPSWSSAAVLIQTADDYDILAEQVHEVFDLLPEGQQFVLDIVWILPRIPTLEETSLSLYGALKRGVAWHGANVYLVHLERWDEISSIRPDDITRTYDRDPPCSGFALHRYKNDVLKDLRVHILSVSEVEKIWPRHLVWRGSLMFTEEETYSKLSLEYFELHAMSESARDLRAASCNRESSIFDGPLSNEIDVLSAKTIADIPKRLLTDKVFTLQATTQLGCNHAKAFLDSECFRGEKCIIVRLKYGISRGPSKQKSMQKSKQTTEWKRAVANGTFDSVLDQNDKGFDGILHFVLLSRDGDQSAEKVAVLLQPSRVRLSSLNIMVAEDMIESVYNDYFGQYALDHDFSTSEEDCGDESEWPEHRLLAFLKYQKMKEVADTSNSSAVPPQLGAEELVKYYTAYISDENWKSEPITAKRFRPLADCTEEELQFSEWPSILAIDYHGVQYNRSQHSEEAERDSCRIQSMLIGSKETTSTFSLHDVPRFVRTYVPKLSSEKVLEPATADTVKSNPSVLKPRRDNPRVLKEKKSQPPASIASSSASIGISDKSSVFRQKVRTAVYAALVNKAIDERHILFRRCFRRLFDICLMYANDIPKTISTSTWLQSVASQHAETVVSLEQTLNVLS